MKRQINEQLQKKGDELNVKLGRGGIREIEFIGQAFQLLRGGRDNSLQERSIIKVFDLLAEKKLITADTGKLLLSNYRYLRKLENALQEIADEQTHQLPTDEKRRLRLVCAMRCKDWTTLLADTHRVMEQVHCHFNTLVDIPVREQTGRVETFDFLGANQLELAQYLEPYFGVESSKFAQRITDFCRSYSVRKLSDKGRIYLPRLLAALFDELRQMEQAEGVLYPLLDMLEKVCNRTAYLVLLVENKHVLKRLVCLAVASPWVVAQVARSPILLDELIAEKGAHTPPTRSELVFELDGMIAHADGDAEQQMEVLRVFKQTNAFRIAVADLTEAIPIMVVSDKLTEIAEVIVQQTLALSWSAVTEKYGAPRGASKDAVDGFGIIAYGKLGGIELGFGSDLDLVFLHRQIEQGEMTEGETPVALDTFYNRLTRKIISFLTTRTFYGPLYEIDLRLRPNGNSGLLVSSLKAYEQYQLNTAWTWEQQALVRARPVAACLSTTNAFNAIRQAVLARERDLLLLRIDVVEMRAKMRDAIRGEKKQGFDLKQGLGGIVDIEFIVQFGVLANAYSYEALLGFTDNVCLIEGLEEIGFLSAEQAAQLSGAYTTYREAAHHAVLASRSNVVESDRFQVHAKNVHAIWNEILDNKHG
jgi:glutamate-ammonia-ligase adenylyltransferase